MAVKQKRIKCARCGERETVTKGERGPASGIRADTVAKIIMRIACRGADFLHSTVIAQDEGQEAHPLSAFYLFGALGKNSQDAWLRQKYERTPPSHLAKKE